MVAPYSFLLNASYARELPGKLTMEVGYVGRLGRKNLLQVDTFQPLTRFKDAKSGQGWDQMAGTLYNLQLGGLTPAQVKAGLQGTRDFIADVRASVEAGAKAGKDLNAVYKDTMARLAPKYGHWVIFNHCMPFDVTRAYDEATQFPDPRIWTAERDIEMWKALET